MSVFDDMDEAAVLVSQYFDDDAVSLGLATRVKAGKYTPEWRASYYGSRTKYSTIEGKGNSFVESVQNLVVAVRAYESATMLQSDVVHVERNVLQLPAPAEATIVVSTDSIVRDRKAPKKDL